MTQTKPSATPVRVAVADEPELVTLGLAAMLAPYDDLALVPPSPGGGLATFVDVTLHDTFARLPLSEVTLDRLVGRPAGGRVVVYSWQLPDDMVAIALTHGAAGCVSKLLPADELADALRAVASGETVVRKVADDSSAARQVGLTPREHEVIGLIAAGLTNHEIAATLSLSTNSIKTYIRAAYRKIQARSRSQAVLWAVRHGIVTEPATRPVTDDRVRVGGPAA
jgi:DNA-binding CsgD family transcriptional regulator